MAGYSKTPLVQKLGIKGGQKIYIGNAPPRYRQALGALPEKVTVAKSLDGPCDFLHLFVKDKTALELAFPNLKKHLESNGCLWISWPKGASGVKTDLNENLVREVGLKNGLVDVKVCAVDDVWSGLKFVFRLKDR